MATNITVTSLTGKSGVKQNSLSCTTDAPGCAGPGGLPYNGLLYVELLASTNNSVGSAFLVGQSAVGIFVHGNLSTNQTWYYWARAVDASGQVSNYYPPGSGVQVTTQNEIPPANSVGTTQIATEAVTEPKVADSAVTVDKLAANSVVAGKIAANAVTANAIAANSIIAGKIAANAVTANAIAANAITAGKIAADAVTAGTIAAGAVDAGTIAAGAVTAGTIAANAISAININANQISTSKIVVGGIDATALALGAATAVAVGAGSITAFGDGQTYGPFATTNFTSAGGNFLIIGFVTLTSSWSGAMGSNGAAWDTNLRLNVSGAPTISVLCPASAYSVNTTTNQVAYRSTGTYTLVFGGSLSAGGHTATISFSGATPQANAPVPLSAVIVVFESRR